jgi:hypothetical protein
MKPDLDSAINDALEWAVGHDDFVADSFEVVREKHIGDDAVIAMTFRRRSTDDLRRSCHGVAWSERDGWHTAGGAWTSSVVDRPPRGIWLSWGGWGPGSGDGLHVKSGWLADPRAVALVVTDTSGRKIHDRIENGVAILTWRGDFSAEHSTAELFGAHGEVLTREPLEPRRVS